MTEGTFEDGYRDGWGTVAGDVPAPPLPADALMPDQKAPYQAGFEYGRAEALTRFKSAN
jgi:hypothetical protein